MFVVSLMRLTVHMMLDRYLKWTFVLFSHAMVQGAVLQRNDYSTNQVKDQIFNTSFVIKLEGKPLSNGTGPLGCSDYMDVRLFLGDEEVILYLELNEGIRYQDMPVYIDNGQTVKLWVSKHGRPHKCMYQDFNMGAIMTVTTDKGDRQMEGTFHFKDSAYQVQPIHKISSIKKRSTDTKYDHSVKYLGASKYSPPSKLSRKRRGSGTLYTIETSIVVDYAGYMVMFEAASNTNTRKRDTIEDQAMEDTMAYTSYIANAIDWAFSSISDPDAEFRVVPLGIYVSTDASSSPWTEKDATVIKGEAMIDADKVLDHFAKWVPEDGKNHLQNSDTYMLFTGKDIGVVDKENGRRVVTQVTGAAWLETICTSDSVSVSKLTTDMITAISGAHELGHIMGSEHDGEGNSCSALDHYTMEPGRETYIKKNFYKNMMTFSSCSINYMKKFCEKRNQCKCLMNEVTPFDEFEGYVSTVIGQRFDLEWQCKATFGEESDFCGADEKHESDDELCRWLWCIEPKKGGICTKHASGAFLGSSCGDNKWCDRGKCVFNESAPLWKYGSGGQDESTSTGSNDEDQEGENDQEQGGSNGQDQGGENDQEQGGSNGQDQEGENDQEQGGSNGQDQEGSNDQEQGGSNGQDQGESNGQDQDGQTNTPSYTGGGSSYWYPHTGGWSPNWLSHDLSDAGEWSLYWYSHDSNAGGWSSGWYNWLWDKKQHNNKHVRKAKKFGHVDSEKDLIKRLLAFMQEEEGNAKRRSVI